MPVGGHEGWDPSLASCSPPGPQTCLSPLEPHCRYAPAGTCPLPLSAVEAVWSLSTFNPQNMYVPVPCPGPCVPCSVLYPALTVPHAGRTARPICASTAMWMT